jgi:5-hydroxyisourate hydrolase
MQLATGITNEDGRIADLLDNDFDLVIGIYKMHFVIGNYFNNQQRSSFYPYADIIFEIKSTEEHYHIPLLLSPYGYTTYRGS